jgi:hypothetical protein
VEWNTWTKESATELFELSVRGVPTNWVSVPAPVIRLAPGEQREVLLTVQPPAFRHAHAGRHTLVVRAARQAGRGKSAEANIGLLSGDNGGFAFFSLPELGQVFAIGLQVIIQDLAGHVQVGDNWIEEQALQGRLPVAMDGGIHTQPDDRELATA